MHVLAAAPVDAQTAGRDQTAAPPMGSLRTLTSGTSDTPEQPPAAQLLDDLVREALVRNLQLQQQRLGERQAASGIRQARGVLLPTLAVDARYSEFSGVVNIGEFINPAYEALNQLLGQDVFPTNVAATLPFRQETRLRATQVVYNQAAIEQWRLARTLHGLSVAQQELAARQIAADVQLAWLALAGATRVVDVYSSALTVLDENERVADRLVEYGQGTADAVFRARADRADVAQQLADAERQRDAARRMLNALLDRDPDTPIPVVDDSTLVRPLPADRDATIADALARREELEQAALGVTIADRQVKLVSTAFLPSVALAADWGIQGDRYRFDGSGNVAVASLVLQWNLFNGGQDAARREQAQLERRRAELRRRDTERQVTVQVAQAWDAAQVAERALATAAARLDAAQRSFTLVSRRYEEGLAPHIEYVSAREALTQAELNAVLTRFTYAARRVDLERAAALRALTP
jgi:outer membrane protein TolC